MTVEDRRLLAVFVVAFAFGAALAAFIGARPARVLPNCLCGCPASAHEHNRPGTWCARCPRFGDDACVRYEPNRSRPSWLDDHPELPTDGEEQAEKYLNALSILLGHPKWDGLASA